MKRKTQLRRMLPIMLMAILIGSTTLSIVQAPPLLAMSIYGTVYIDGVPATAGYHIYAKVGTEIVDLVEGSQDVTDADGEYSIGIGPASGLDDGISIDLWVEDCNCTTITLEYNNIPLEEDLTCTGTTADNVPPVADAGGPYSGLTGAAISFDGSGSTDSDGAIVSYA